MGGGWEGESKEELSPSCESVPDPQLNDSILDPDVGGYVKAHDTCKYVCATFMREITFDYILVKKMIMVSQLIGTSWMCV